MREYLKSISALLLTLAVLFFVSLSTTSAEDIYKVKRVIDGDTFVLGNGEKVRLIGIDAPETVHPSKPVEYFGKEASKYAKKLLEGETVRLEYDQQERDRFDRILAYAFIDTLFVNAELIRGGYAHVYLRYPFQMEYQELFLRLEQEARVAKRGLWAEPPTPEIQFPDLRVKKDPTVYVNKSGSKIHRAGCRDLEENAIPIELSKAKKKYSPCSACKPPK